MKMLLAAALTTALIFSTALALADGGHSHGIGKPGDRKKVSRTVDVTMNDQMRFVPDSVRVKRGETIRFVVRNIGQMKHELVIGMEKDLKEHATAMQKHPEMEHDDPNAVSVEPGRTGELIWQFTQTGNLKFACLVPGHFEAGMVGRLTVH
jgi:uncharacterized cupredoxin-like copper-binding protein